MERNLLWFFILALVGLAALFMLWPKQTCEASRADCNQPDSDASKSSTINAELKAGTALLVDVREPSEFASGHALDSINVPLSQIQNGDFAALDKEKELFIYCRSGQRAETAKAILTKHGYDKVENIGGLSDWRDMGGKTVQ